jgi:hypothetical protein
VREREKKILFKKRKSFFGVFSLTEMMTKSRKNSASSHFHYRFAVPWESKRHSTCNFGKKHIFTLQTIFPFWSSSSPSLATGLPDFSWYNISKWENRYQIAIKIPKSHKLHISNSRKIDQIANNIPISSIARPSKIYPNPDFWYQKNVPSGNPGRERTNMVRKGGKLSVLSKLKEEIFFGRQTPFNKKGLLNARLNPESIKNPYRK